ncbi:hypothetical protein HOF78_01015 [Candidatus Woesearchaeota archaeon]|jgi:cytochrome c oxidase subunit II|nr:hypothetical protein [Candidatus Woesearchaeota archaeon]MBT6045033.1 hypothetical protein [Candidatus Woesearchaeota archaeon]
MKRGLILIILTTLVLLIGCNPSATEENPSQQGIPEIEEPPGMSIVIENENIPKTTSNIKEFEITAKNWEFNPSIINVDLGNEVILHITSLDVTHGILIPEFNINEDLQPGQSIDIKFTADKIGEFSFSCSVFCGSGHSHMAGKIIVT